jgi:hypothetical protein
VGNISELSQVEAKNNKRRFEEREKRALPHIKVRLREYKETEKIIDTYILQYNCLNFRKL